jgi:polyhydroxybutyrate depolymerase
MLRILFASILCAAVVAAVSSSSPVFATSTSVDCSAYSLSLRICGDSTPFTQTIGSPGCSPSRPHGSGTSAETITTGDGQRSYRLHVPPSYTGSNAVPLLFNVHGATSNATAQEVYSGFSAKADVEGFIVVYPEGVITAAIPYTHFNAWMFGSPEPNDVGFIDTLLDSLELQLCIDTSRVFSTGISNGAMLSVRLACSLSNRIAAIAPVAGAYYAPDFVNVPTEVCPGTTAVPVIAFHGTADTIVPFNGGLGGVSGTTNFRLPVDNNTVAEDVMADWSAHNRCTSGRQESQVDTEIRLIRYDSCARGATVELYAVDGGGHTWPGSFDVPHLGYTTRQISATDLMWAFFSAHPLIPASVGGTSEPPAVAGIPSTTASFGGDSPAHALGGAAMAAIGASGWYARRKRRRCRAHTTHR